MIRLQLLYIQYRPMVAATVIFCDFKPFLILDSCQLYFFVWFIWLWQNDVMMIHSVYYL